MYIPIYLNLDGIIEEFGLTQENILLLSNEIIDKVANEIVSTIRKNVQSTAKSSRQIYLDNLKIEKIDEQTREIVLSGWLANAIESGTPSFDMKEGFKRSSKVKYNNKGKWYLTIPFDFSTPTSSGESGTLMPKEIYSIVKKQTTWLKKSQIPESYNSLKTKEIIRGGNKEEYTHKSSIYEGIKKNDSGNYQSMRRVGEASDTNAFIHPGIIKKDYFGQALLELDPIIPIITSDIIDNFLEDIGGSNF